MVAPFFVLYIQNATGSVLGRLRCMLRPFLDAPFLKIEVEPNNGLWVVGYR